MYKLRDFSILHINFGPHATQVFPLRPQKYLPKLTQNSTLLRFSIKISFIVVSLDGSSEGETPQQEI